MKINGFFNSIIAGATATPRKDGSGYYYNLSLIDEETNEAGMISCEQAVYDVVSSKDFKRFTPHKLGTIYDSQYKWLRITSID